MSKTFEKLDVMVLINFFLWFIQKILALKAEAR